MFLSESSPVPGIDPQVPSNPLHEPERGTARPRRREYGSTIHPGRGPVGADGVLGDPVGEAGRLGAGEVVVPVAHAVVDRERGPVVGRGRNGVGREGVGEPGLLRGVHGEGLAREVGPAAATLAEGGELEGVALDAGAFEDLVGGVRVGCGGGVAAFRDRRLVNE